MAFEFRTHNAKRQVNDLASKIDINVDPRLDFPVYGLPQNAQKISLGRGERARRQQQCAPTEEQINLPRFQVF